MNRSRIVRAVAAALTLTSTLATAASVASADLPPGDLVLPAALLRWAGEGSSATGNAVANGACDVNGDGHGDSVVGAWFWDKAPIDNVGAAYVVFGGADLHAGSLASPADVGAVRIDGPPRARSGSNGYSVGFAVGCLGDVNEDGFDDIGIGDYQEQQAFVIFGAADFQPLGVDSMGSRGFVVAGDPVTGGNVGYSMSPLGDVNDDGRDDFAIAEIAADTQGRTNNGRIWVIAGRADIDDVDLTAPASGDVLFTVDGATNEERLSVVSSAGDVDGDGVDDILLGSYVSTPFGASVAVPGAAYVVFGGATGAVDTAALGAGGFTITGPARQRDRLGVAVSAVGDVNGDGLADLLIGADGVSNATTGSRNGGAVVVFGSASTATVHTDPVGAIGAYTCAAASTLGVCADPADVQPRGYWIEGAATDDKAGFSVAGIGDVNADDVPDLLIGAWGHDPADPAEPSSTMSNAGNAYVLFGKTTFTPQSLGALTSAEGFELVGLAAGDRFGRQVAAVGDVDGNGVADVAVGADFASRPLPAAAGLSQSGELLVALMGEITTTTVVTSDAATIPLNGTVNLTAQVTIQGGAPAGAGAVSFAANGVPVGACTDVPVDAAGVATCATTLPVAGVHQLVATYGGASNWAGSASQQLPITVPQEPTDPDPVDPGPDPDPDPEPAPPPPAGASTYVPEAPCRLADTRSTAGFERLDAATIRVVAAGRCGVPANATAVAITLTADAAADGGYVTAWPSGLPRPNASNLNYLSGQTRANGAIIPLGDGGAIDVYSFVAAGLLVDVSGAFVPADSLPDGRFTPLQPERLLDTRVGGVVAAGGTVTVPLPASVPADATAVALNVTVTQSTGNGYVTAWPAATPMPEASVVNTDGPGQTRAAGVIVPTGVGGIELFASSEMHLIVDVTGFFTGVDSEPSTEGLFVPLPPERLLDTRGGGQLAAGETVGLAVDDVDAVALATNVTIVDPATPGWIVAYPAGTAQPATSTVNASVAFENAASLALPPLGAGGLAIYADSATDVLVDRTGYFTSELPVVDPEEPPAEPPAEPGDPTPLSVAYAQRNWVPTEYDTCPIALHASYSAIGPDGKRYPTWHPPTVVDPATGQTCTFGHEHGDDPATSDIYDWAMQYFAPAGASAAAGIPFGLSSEALVDYAGVAPGQVVRHEDHVGHKVFVADDVRLVAASPRGYVRFVDGSGASVPVECDYLIKTHQGSHSADATTNNAHEIFYAVRCNDGTEIAATVMSRFGDANEYTRSCDRSVTVQTSGSNLPNGDGGARLLPDRTCVEDFVLVDPTDAGEHSDIWSLYEVWQSANAITTSDGRTLASFDPWFAVRNPSRYGWSGKNADGSDGIGYTLDASWETGTGDAGVVNAQPWLAVCMVPPFAPRSPHSPFDGAERDFYVRTTSVANASGATVWYTNPWGAHASPTPFTGSIRQWIGATDNTWYPTLERQNFGLGTDYNNGQGVHAPN